MLHGGVCWDYHYVVSIIGTNGYSQIGTVAWCTVIGFLFPKRQKKNNAVGS